MSAKHALRLSTILLVFVSFIGLVLGARQPAPLVWLTGSALILALLHAAGVPAMERFASYVRLSAAGWNSILVIAFAGFLTDMLWLSGELLPAGIHFLLVLMVIKLWTLRTRRDHLQLHAISLVALLASGALTTDLWYLPLCVAYLFCGVWTLFLFQLTKPFPDAAGPTHDPRHPGGTEEEGRVTPQLFWLANGVASAALGVSFIIFFAIPRVSAGWFQTAYGDSIRTSGFSDTVDLGAIGPIKRDPSIVMRVEVPDRSARASGRLYLRGVAYDRYDGTSWTNQLPHKRPLPETAPMSFSVRQRPARSPVAGPVIRQHILLESLDTAVLFAAPFAESITGRFPTLQTDAMGALSLPFPSSTRIEYTVISRPTAILPADRQSQSVSYPSFFIRHFLQTPAQSDRVAALAATVTQDAFSRYDKAVAIERFLSTNFRYSLDAPLANQTRPIDDFLFTRKTGYCEHYATAMVLMLRAIGIPARLVTGFLATEWNEYGNYYVVRQQDAHAWVEVHLPHSGWVLMDPTPVSFDGTSASGWQAFSRILDAFRLRWNRLFVQYNAADQLAVVRGLKAGGAAVRSQVWGSLTAFFESFAEKETTFLFGRNGRVGGMGLIAVLVLPLGLFVWLARYRLLGRLVGVSTLNRQESPITRLYKAMLDHLARNGISKPPTTAPIEFLNVVHEQWAGAGSLVTTITELYCRGRFGPTGMTEEDLLLAQQALRQLLLLHRS